MILVKEKKECCGCNACVQICPQGCIYMETDAEGFMYPKVNTEVCINCGLCDKACPIINQNQPRRPHAVYASKNKNDEIRKQSSSGAIFTLLAESVIAQNGIVFGARFDKNWDVVHSWTDNVDGLAVFRGSKYVQSKIGDSYKEVRSFLQQGRKVLFSGTPCQIAGLNRFLRKKYENLLTIDVVCHGVPSPLVWRKYLDEIRESNMAQVRMGNSFIIKNISFRDKTNGWKNYNIRITSTIQDYLLNPSTDSKGVVYNDFVQPYKDNIFMKGFLANLYLRPSCYECKVRSGKSGSDISIGDFWGVQNFYPKFDDDKGVGLILINTNKGEEAYASIEVEEVKVTYNQGLAGNPCLEHSVTSPRQRELFFETLHIPMKEQLEPLLKQIRPNFFYRLYRKVRVYFGNIKRKLFDK